MATEAGMTAIPDDLIEDVVYEFETWAKAPDEYVKAAHLVELFNKMSDLKSWHPSFDSHTGTLDWERDDV